MVFAGSSRHLLPIFTLAYFVLRLSSGVSDLFVALELSDYRLVSLGVVLSALLFLVFSFNRRGKIVAAYLSPDQAWLDRGLILFRVGLGIYLPLDCLQDAFLKVAFIEVGFQLINLCLLCATVEMYSIDCALLDRDLQRAEKSNRA